MFLDAGKPTVLWLAADAQDSAMVEHLIQLDGIEDLPAKDGTTAMAVALGRRNPEIVQHLLLRFLGGESGHNVQYLAQEYLKDTNMIKLGDDDYDKVTGVRNAIIDVMGEGELEQENLHYSNGNRDTM